MDFIIQNMDQLTKDLSELLDEQKIEDAVKKACLIVEAEARRKAPRESGDLRRSISSKVESHDDSIEGTVYSNLEYAPYIEYGTGLFAEGGEGRKDVPWSYQDDEGVWHSTSGIKPTPYLRPALYESKEKILNAIKEGIIK